MKKWAKSVFRPVIFSSLKDYSSGQFKKDLISGLIVGVVALPLGLAFAIASGVAPEKGLVTAVIAGLVGGLCGGSKVLISGPTGAFVLITSAIINKHGLEGLAFSTFLAGLILITLGVLKLGKVIKFIPYPIVIGFNAGIALSIFTSQVKEFLGLTIDTNPQNFIARWIAVFENIDTFNLWAIGLGLLTIIIIILTPKISPKIPGFLAAIVIIAGIAYVLRNQLGITEIRTIADCYLIDDRFPMPQNIDFRFDAIKDYLSSAITIAIMGAIVSLITATVADGAISEKQDPNTELIGQGLTNLVIPIFGGIPSTGAIARTMTSVNNGGRTPVVSLVHALVVLIILLCLGSLSRFIPTACLAGMLVVASYNMSGWRSIRGLYKGPKSDFLVMLTTLSLTVLFDLSIAIEVGLLLAVFLFMKRVQDTSSISIATESIDPSEGTDLDIKEKLIIPKKVEVYEIDGPFFFGIANKFDEQMSVIGVKPRIRIIRMRHVPFIDATGLQNLQTLMRNSHKEHIKVLLSGVNQNVFSSLSKSGFIKEFGDEIIFCNITDALDEANRLLPLIDKQQTKK
ncbi:MAG: SulP family inorganic anion transporter [Bacteroidales bacterium]